MPKLELNHDNSKAFMEIDQLYRTLLENSEKIDKLNELEAVLEDAPNESILSTIQNAVLPTLYHNLGESSEKRKNFSEKDRIIIVGILNTCFKNTVTDNHGVFFNIYNFLVSECFNQQSNKIRNISEEYKLIIMECMKSVSNSVSSKLIPKIYTNQNAVKLCLMICIATQMATYESMRTLRIASIECIMAMARVLEDAHFQDVAMRRQIAELFVFFLPGVSTGLQKIILEDVTVGHKVPLVAMKAWGRLMTLWMQDYSPSENGYHVYSNQPITSGRNNVIKFESQQCVQNYLTSTNVRSLEWYRLNDQNLEKQVKEFRKLTTRSHPDLRNELLKASQLILENCMTTMPKCARHFIEMVIILTEDEDEQISKKSTALLSNTSAILLSPDFSVIVVYMIRGFDQCIENLPRIFSGIDEDKKLASVNLLIGYISLFGSYKLTYVLLSDQNLNIVLQRLFVVSELVKYRVAYKFLPDPSRQILDNGAASIWKQFVNFRDDRVQEKVEKLCRLLARGTYFRMVVDALLDKIQNNIADKLEAIFVLNASISGCNDTTDEDALNTVVLTYVDPRQLDVPLEVSEMQGCSLEEMHRNITQVCILLDGIGIIASKLGRRFQYHLPRALYLVFEKAGNQHPFVCFSGRLALKRICKACGYTSIKEMISSSIDFISFHVKNRLRRLEDKEKVLQVVTIILKTTTLDALPIISNMMEFTVKSLDADTSKATMFLVVFNEFILTLREWVGIERKFEPIKSREQRYQEMQEFTVSGIEEDFSDNLDEMSAEEMFREDLQKKEEELIKEIEKPEVEEYKKPEPPVHVILTVNILRRALYFLPSKNPEQRMKAFEVILNGIEILEHWEDELLPMVHEIWSPLVERFKEIDDPLTINYSFNLLTILGRLSKEFIRMRTTKEVLPHILQLLETQSNSSMNIRSSSYMYSQVLKLQLRVLKDIGRLMVHLDVEKSHIEEVVDKLLIYMRNKQPTNLQEAAMESIESLMTYDKSAVIPRLTFWQRHVGFSKRVSSLLECHEPSNSPVSDAVQSIRS